MPLSPELVLALAAQCAPGVAPPTLLAIAQAESALDPLAIGVNGPKAPRGRANSIAEAVSVASSLIKGGRDLDLGLTQINVRNLPRLGLSLEAAFDGLSPRDPPRNPEPLLPPSSGGALRGRLCENLAIPRSHRIALATRRMGRAM